MTDIIETTEPEAPRRRQWPRDYGRNRPEGALPAWRCKKCHCPRTRTLDVKEIGDEYRRRRRECLNCGYVWTHVEKIETPEPQA